MSSVTKPEIGRLLAEAEKTEIAMCRGLIRRGELMLKQCRARWAKNPQRVEKMQAEIDEQCRRNDELAAQYAELSAILSTMANQLEAQK